MPQAPIRQPRRAEVPGESASTPVQVRDRGRVLAPRSRWNHARNSRCCAVPNQSFRASVASVSGSISSMATGSPPVTSLEDRQVHPPRPWLCLNGSDRPDLDGLGPQLGPPDAHRPHGRPRFPAGRSSASPAGSARPPARGPEPLGCGRPHRPSGPPNIWIRPAWNRTSAIPWALSVATAKGQRSVLQRLGLVAPAQGVEQRNPLAPWPASPPPRAAPRPPPRAPEGRRARAGARSSPASGSR